MKSVIYMNDLNDIKGVILDSTFLSYQSVTRSILKNYWLTWPFQLLSYILISDKYAVQDDIKKISPLPLLIIHGKNDPVVPYYLGKNLYKTALEPKIFFPVEKGKHIDSMWIDNGKHRKVFVDFIFDNTINQN